MPNLKRKKNNGYTKRRKPKCKLCKLRLTVCNKGGAHRRQLTTEVDVIRNVLTVYFPYCGNFYCTEFSQEFKDWMALLSKELIRQWNSPVRGTYAIGVGVSVGIDQPETIWQDGYAVVPMCGLWTDQEVDDLRIQIQNVVYNILNTFHYPAPLNSVCIERRQTSDEIINQDRCSCS